MTADLLEKINFFREKLHNVIFSESLDSELVLRFSEELDQLIVEYIKTKH